MGGLATGLRLLHHGFNVTIVEKLPRPGGRSNVIEENGFRVDTGPTILVMKDTFKETYQAIGQDLDARLDFISLDPNYRIYFHDGTHLDLYNGMAQLSAEVERIEPGAKERLFRFLGASAMKYELAMEFVERNYDHITDLANPLAGWRLFRTRAYQKLYTQVAKFFHTDKLRKAFSFHSMFLGLSPFDALAMYSLITYADIVEGMHYPRGGIYAVVEDMVALFEEMGGTLYTNTPVAEILVEDGRAVGVRLGQRPSANKRGRPSANKRGRPSANDSSSWVANDSSSWARSPTEALRADLIVSNADLPYTYTHLIAPGHRRHYSDQRLARMQYACSGYLLYLGVDKVYPQMRHQALYFAEDYRANLDAIFRAHTLPDEISFHLNNPTVTDTSLAPPGHSLLYLLAPMPNTQANVDGAPPIRWEEAAPLVREQLVTQLEQLVDPDIRRHIVWEREYRPPDYARDINAVYGTAFGSLSHGFFQSAYFRPHNKARDIEGLYFVGQGTYPGIGMPMVLISARLVTERILHDHAR
jgi:phytoene desaturase